MLVFCFSKVACKYDITRLKKHFVLWDVTKGQRLEPGLDDANCLPQPDWDVDDLWILGLVLVFRTTER